MKEDGKRPCKQDIIDQQTINWKEEVRIGRDGRYLGTQPFNYLFKKLKNILKKYKHKSSRKIKKYEKDFIYMNYK